MKRYRFDAIVVGCGAAGATAAVTMARAGLSVLVLEAGVYAGAENWSGCVYFAENLAQPDVFGEKAVSAAPFERRLVRRGIFLHNGLEIVGLSHQSPDSFRHCYTVLRPIYDPYWATLVQAHGAVLLPQTTVTSLIRRGGRVTGVETEHGPVYAEVVFIAEGDASHLIRRERLERIGAPRFMQGVKAVFNLPSAVIDERFGLAPGEGCAHEYLIRNGQSGGQTIHLNIGAFLYTNRDSVSFGYVVPLDNLRESYRGDHDRLLEWLRGLPYFHSVLDGASLSAYGAKLIRSGGVREQPILIENGLAVGGAATGLGIDLPYPNFTGPASASGMFFARAVRGLLKDGQPITADRLRENYLEPLQSSVYGLNAAFLSAWPDYLEKTRFFFGRSADLACGLSHFLSQPKGRWRQTARFLRGYLTPKALRELLQDASGMMRASGLRSAFFRSLTPSLIGHWISSLFKSTGKADPGFSIFIRSMNGQAVDLHKFPWPIRGWIGRLSPGLAEGMKNVYANDGRPLSEKFDKAVWSVLARLNLSDWITLPVLGFFLACLVLESILQDLFRYYILRHSAARILGGPVSDYQQEQQLARDLDRVKTRDSFESKLATNSYRLGGRSHIRVIWPDELARHGDLAQSPLWSVCPARVYQYDPPLLGRGAVTINYENCIKCETCWHAADEEARWGRHTDHRLIYRPESMAFQTLLSGRFQSFVPHPPRETGPVAPHQPGAVRLQGRNREILNELSESVGASLRAMRALEIAVENLPASADATRREWPLKIGHMALKRMNAVSSRLSSDEIRETFSDLEISTEMLDRWHQTAEEDQKDLERQCSIGQVFHALTAARRIRAEVLNDIEDLLRPLILEQNQDTPAFLSCDPKERNAQVYDLVLENRISALFPDRDVKEWEELPIPHETRNRLHSLILEYKDRPLSLIRALSTASPALGLLAARHAESLRTLEKTEQPLRSDLCAVDSHSLSVKATREGITIDGALELVPLALANDLLFIHQGQGWVVSPVQVGVKRIPTPSIGFRSAGLHRLEFNAAKASGPPLPTDGGPIVGMFYTAVALGTADYLARRVKEHAEGRIQFTHQMRDTQGRDGIAKLGAVKAMIARIEAWRLLLSVLLSENGEAAHRGISMEWPELFAAISAMAFGPDSGQMGYDAGQVFGGFAYSEDDLLSRAYRDSALFRFLRPGYGAAEQLMGRLLGEGLAPLASDAMGGRVFEEVRMGPLAETAKQWDMNISRWNRLYSKTDTAKAGEAAAMLIGACRVLCRVQDRLEAGLHVEAEAAAATVLVGMVEQAVDIMGFWRRDHSLLPVTSFPERPEEKQVDLTIRYEEICDPGSDNPAGPYQSGQYLLDAFDSSPRFVPEIQLHDPLLRERWESCTSWFLKNFWTTNFDGMHIERYVEKIHGIPEGVLDGFKHNGYFSTVIPSELDGGNWWKAEYYILTTAAGRFGDAGLLLVIMASTSIGTTPMLLGLEKELPLAVQELEPLAREPLRLGDIGERLDRLIAGMKRPDPARLKKSFTELINLVDSRIRNTRVVKYLAANFLKTFYAAAIAGKRRDLGGFHRGLVESKALFDYLTPTIRQAVDELPRRERAHQFFLKKLGHGGISAFALTEPTAGSDTGGVKTTARPMSRPLTPLQDGRYLFYPFEDRPMDDRWARYLIDADRIRFDDRTSSSGMVYELTGGEMVAIRLEEYDYDTDEGLRYYIQEGQKRYFHDVAQIRSRDNRAVYDYYELSGAKMWITNGRVATQYCLYAQSLEGVTGFMVDRYSEGLKIGADERKMGQRGSPTNEIAIDQVRVPKECVIGYEGHGQVNALETLNVGRCGLAVASITLMRKLLIEASEQLPASPERDRYLGEAAAILFGSDSVTYYLIGLFDRDTTESVRMESAIAKYVCSEDLHELIGLIEQAYGPAGVTERYRVEKIRRDSRILNIYEGTNEVQRFLILKDLTAMIKEWKPKPVPNGSNIESRLAYWKETLRSHVKGAADLLGDTVWMDAVLQPTYFPLADMAGEIFRLDCLAYRTRWLKENRERLGSGYADPLLTLARRAVERCEYRLSVLDRWYRPVADRAVKGLYAPEATAADSALDGMAVIDATGPLPAGRLTRALRILCLLRPVAEVAPTPRLNEGRLAEMVWRINPSDEAAAVLAVRLKNCNPLSVTVHVLMPGGSEADQLLRWSLGSGVDAAYRLEASATADGSVFSEAIPRLEESGKYDLILTGFDSEDGAEPLGPFVAGKLSRPFARARSLEIVKDGQELSLRTLSDPSRSQWLPREPVVLAWEQTALPLRVEINRLIQGRLAPIGCVPAREQRVSEQWSPARGVAQKSEIVRDLAGVADYLKAYQAQARALEAEPYRSVIQVMPLPSRSAVWTILETKRPKAVPALIGAACLLGKSLDLDTRALILGPESEWPRLVGLAQARGMTGAFCVPAPEGPLSETGRIEWIKRFSEAIHDFRIVCDHQWGDSLANLSGRVNGKAATLFTDVMDIDRREGLSLFKPVYGGKLRRSISLGTSQTPILLMTVSPTAEFPQGEPSSRFSAGRVDPKTMAIDPTWTEPAVSRSQEDLSTAELIVDVGYGVRNQQGFNIAVRLKDLLERMGLTVYLGATRKVTQDLKLLPVLHQIGQTGVRVNPKLIFAIGISGAPQHMDFIGNRAVIFAFNKDPQAPLMKYNETRPSPVVHPIVGDLFETVPKLIEILSPP